MGVGGLGYLRDKLSHLTRFIQSVELAVRRKIASLTEEAEPPYISVYSVDSVNLFVTDPALPDRRSLVDYAAKDILSARDEIDMTFYRMEEGKELDHLVELLAKAQSKHPNLKINIVVNMPSDADKLLSRLTMAGVKASLKAFNSTTIDSLRYSEHSKYMIIDGRVAYVSDENVQDKPENEKGKGYKWFGLSLRLQGEVVKGLMQVFKRAWNTSVSVKLQGTPERLPINEVGTPVKRAKDIVRLWREGGLEDKVVLAYSEPWKNTFLSYILHGKRDDLRDLNATLIRNAEREVKMITPNLSSLRVILAIVEALRRGVKVKLLLPKDFNEEINLLLDPENVGDNMRALAILKRLAGKHVSNLEVRWYSNDGKRPEVGNYAPTSHAKYLSVDGEVASYGSFNQDITSQKICRETNVIIFGDRVKELESEFFNEVWDRGVKQDLNEVPDDLALVLRTIYKTLRTIFLRVKHASN